MKPKLNPEEVAELLGVDNNTLKLWRSPQRLKGGKDNPLYLPVTAAPANKNVVWYSSTDLMAFLKRNPKYAERVISTLAPQPLRDTFLPLSRNRATPAASTDWHNVATTTP